MLHPLTFSVKIIAGTDEEKEQVQIYIEYGMPFTSLPAEVIGQDCQLPVGRSYEGFRRGIIKSFDLNSSNCIRSASLFWEGCGELQLIVDKTTHGTKGVFFSAHDDTETFRLSNNRSRDGARTYRFLSEATDKKVDLRINGTSALSFNLAIRDNLIDLINKIYGWRLR